MTLIRSITSVILQRFPFKLLNKDLNFRLSVRMTPSQVLGNTRPGAKREIAVKNSEGENL